MSKSILSDMSNELAAESVILNKKLREINERSIAEQYINAATSVGANIMEAKYAETKKDFIHKMSIALKECNETIYWLKIIIDSNIINDEETKELYDKSYSILRMLISTVKTAKRNLSSK